MKYCSTKSPQQLTDFKTAVLKGLAPDGGLYMPAEHCRLPAHVITALKGLSLHELSYEIARLFLDEYFSSSAIAEIVQGALAFDAPLVPLGDGLHVLELFHGPTLAFKDFGARFMARVMLRFAAEQSEKLTILVATSGDTGSAVAHGFHGCPNIDVVILYPSGRVSVMQELQFTTLGDNIHALEVLGTFDDCQRLVKSAFLDPELRGRKLLSSANSINIARLIPQIFYYFRAYQQLPDALPPPVFTVPSGNFGNLTAGLLAKRLGLPVTKFIAATNINDIVPNYLASGSFVPRPAIKTISNAMDVGDPSNFARMIALYDSNRAALQKDVLGISVSDEETRRGITHCYHHSGYVLDPHGGVAYAAMQHYRSSRGQADNHIILETAHPAKFPEAVENAIGKPVEIPDPLKALSKSNKCSLRMQASSAALREFLLEGL